MQEMTMREYFRHTLMEEVRKDAEKRGIKIVDAKVRTFSPPDVPRRPRVVEDDNVVSLKREGKAND